jgi:hypothetical protein
MLGFVRYTRNFDYRHAYWCAAHWPKMAWGVCKRCGKGMEYAIKPPLGRNGICHGMDTPNAELTSRPPTEGEAK